MQIVGFILGIFIGVSLGLIGSGGSILTIPILVYSMYISPSIATVYSLFIVGISALVGGIKGATNKMLDFKMAFYFGIPSVISIYIMRKFLVPLLPPILFEFAGFSVSKDFFIMFVFAVLMVFSSFSMIKKSKISTEETYQIDYKTIILKGIFIGILSGFVGVGGGFLIIPTLLFAARLPMRKAVTTSLIIIAFNSLIGFAGSIENTPIDWAFLLEFTGFSVAGIFAGILLSTKISNEKLKPIFGWFVLITGLYIITKELFFK